MIAACLLILCNSFNMQAQQTDNQLRVSYSTTKDTTITNSHHEPKSVLHREQVSHHFKDDRNKYLNQKAENKKIPISLLIIPVSIISDLRVVCILK